MIRLIKNIDVIFAIMNAFEVSDGSYSDNVTIEKILSDSGIRN